MKSSSSSNSKYLFYKFRTMIKTNSSKLAFILTWFLSLSEQKLKRRILLESQSTSSLKDSDKVSLLMLIKSRIFLSTGETILEASSTREVSMSYSNLLKKSVRETLHQFIWSINMKMDKNMLVKHFLKKPLTLNKMEKNR